MAKGLIFISYRRDDSAGYTRAVHEQLAKRFSAQRIFMDVDTIDPGLPFDQAIEQAVGRCDVLLAMIGRRWLEAQGDKGPRLGNPKDFVRNEIAIALSRNIRVIPVPLDGAEMPVEEVLPEALRPLAMRNAIEISNSRFLSDVERLADAVGRALGETEAPKSTTNTSRRRRALLYVLCGGVASVAAIPAYRLAAPWIRGDEGQPLDASAQRDWRYCDKCQAMFFDGYPTKGVCAGGAHNAQGFNFMLPHDVPGPGQPDWRYCEKCQTMFYDGYPTKGVCAAGGIHRAEGFNFALPHDVPGPGQPNWRYCERCQSMFFDGFPGKGVCPAGGGHRAQGFNFVLPYR